VEEKFADNATFLFRIAVLYDKIGKKEASISRLKKVISINPDDAQALNYLGYTYAEMGTNLNEALRYLKKSCRTPT
jgi:tetratricopeptide (TPR) repeat protein